MNELNITDEMLVAYVNGEADPSQIKAIEDFIASSSKAKALVADLKKTNAVLKNVAAEAMSEPIPEKISALIQKKRMEEQQEFNKQTSNTRKVHLLSSLQKIMTSFARPVPQIAMVAASMVLGVYIGFNALQGNNFNLEQGSYELMVTRGSLSLNEFIPILETILEEKRQTSTITQGDQEYAVNLLDQFELTNTDQCFIGEIKNLDKDTTDLFIGCQADDNSWNINFTSDN
tara:strand:+ start:531 stop:1223 length:693 start_codon:yes stop_codon:yes gene_type:complete